MKSLFRVQRERLRRLAGESPSPSLPSPVSAKLRAPVPVPRPASLSDVQVRSSDGHTSKLRAAPALAPARELATLARSVREGARRAYDDRVAHAAAIDQLIAVLRDLEQRLAAVEQQLDFTVAGSLQGLTEVKDRLQREAGAAAVREVNEAVSTLQVAAYGERGRPLAFNNLVLAGNQLLWGKVDALLRGLGIWSGSAAHPLSWLGPLLSLPVLHQSLGQQQYERYVSGEVTFPATDAAGGPELLLAVPASPRLAMLAPNRLSFSLRAYVAAGFWDELRRRADVPATAQVIADVAGGDQPLRAIASVQGGRLTLMLSAAPIQPVRVVWTVDTGARAP